jgi:starvation-inducible outer membrane lipoprotein
MQWLSESWQTWCGRVILLLALCIVIGCSPVPKKYLREAVPNVTLSKLTETPQAYRDRLVVMGGVILEEEERGEALWLQ